MSGSEMPPPPDAADVLLWDQAVIWENRDGVIWRKPLIGGEWEVVPPVTDNPHSLDKE